MTSQECNTVPSVTLYQRLCVVSTLYRSASGPHYSVWHCIPTEVSSSEAVLHNARRGVSGSGDTGAKGSVPEGVRGDMYSGVRGECHSQAGGFGEDGVQEKI